MPRVTWTAPEIERLERPGQGDERTTLESALDFQRQTLLWKCGGLRAEQLTLRPLPRSSLSLLGLVRHLAGVERWWFRRWFAGEDVDLLYSTDDDLDRDFDGGTAESAEADFATYAVEVELARAVAAGRSFEDTFRRPRGQEVNLRWLYLHVIEEYARHNGHADLLREHIDGRTGD
jgi:hypothetical protein